MVSERVFWHVAKQFVPRDSSGLARARTCGARGEPSGLEELSDVRPRLSPFPFPETIYRPPAFGRGRELSDPVCGTLRTTQGGPMKLNSAERLLVNNPVRAAVQMVYGAPLLRRLGGTVRGSAALEAGCGRGAEEKVILWQFEVRMCLVLIGSLADRTRANGAPGLVHRTRHSDAGARGRIAGASPVLTCGGDREKPRVCETLAGDRLIFD